MNGDSILATTISPELVTNPHGTYHTAPATVQDHATTAPFITNQAEPVNQLTAPAIQEGTQLETSATEKKKLGLLLGQKRYRHLKAA